MIIFVASDYIPHAGGKSSHIVDLSKGLNELGEESIIYSKAQYSKILMKTILLLLRPLKWINSSLYSYSITKVWSQIISKKVLSLYKKNAPTCISVQDAIAAAALKGVRKKIKCPIVLTMHTYFGLENGLDVKDSNLTKKIYAKQMEIDLSSLEVVDKIIAVDQRIKKHVEETVNNEKKRRSVRVKSIVEIINFTNINSFCPLNAEKKEKLREELSLPDNKIIICCVRRLVEKNGVIYAVKAMKHLNENYLLAVAGNGPQLNAIKEEISKEGLEEKVMLLGSMMGDSVRKLYQASDISVVPSITVNGLQEATSITAIESMSCGKPTIASEIGGLRQLIIDHKNGLLVPEGDERSIANAVVELSSNELYDTISKESRKSVVELYSHLAAAKQYLHEFSNV